MTETEPTGPDLDLTRGFRWNAVPPTRGERAAAFAENDAVPPPPLGGIAGFSGAFVGNGFNTIFRPLNVDASPPDLPRPGTGQNDNILELNVTSETLDFSSPLGSIPNRGSVQGDIFLNGIPYVQKIKDITGPSAPVDIHFEPGVWLSVPATTAPEEPVSVVRMASIPHGTTIELQGTSFLAPGGKPFFAPVDITPFVIGNPNQRIPFKSQQVSANDTFRIPQDLTALDAAGTITQAILNNPNILLETRAAAQNITATTVIEVNSKRPVDQNDPLFGGGTDNIAFLIGDKGGDKTKENANAVAVSAIFWVETVSETITVPAHGHHRGRPVIVQGSAAAGDPVATFALHSDPSRPRVSTVEVTYTQIQYTQTVLLDFKGLSWPHVSVATLVPRDPIDVTVGTGR